MLVQPFIPDPGVIRIRDEHSSGGDGGPRVSQGRAAAM